MLSAKKAPNGAWLREIQGFLFFAFLCFALVAICVPLLLQGIELTSEEKSAITNLDRALEKFPRYNGPVKRSLVISDPTELQRFVNTHAVGNTVTYNEYIAATCGKTYNPDAEVQIYIPHSKSGRDI